MRAQNVSMVDVREIFDGVHTYGVVGIEMAAAHPADRQILETKF